MNAFNFPDDFAAPMLTSPLTAMSRPLYDQAACLDADSKLFDATFITSPQAKAALAYCNGCPVIRECLAVLKPDRSQFDGVAGNIVWRGGVMQEHKNDQLF